MAENIGMSLEMPMSYKGHRENVTVWVPFALFIRAVKDYFMVSWEVSIEGPDNRIWNAFSELDAIGKLEDDDYIVGYCTDHIKEYPAYDDAYDGFVDDCDEEDGSSLHEDAGKDGAGLKAGDSVTIGNEGDAWDGRKGSVESVDGDEVVVMIDFGGGRQVRQEFSSGRLAKD